MRKILGIISGILISILLVGLQIFTFYLFSLIGIDYSKPLVYTTSGIFIMISFLLLRLFRKKRFLSNTQFSLTILFTISFYILINISNNYNIHKASWESYQDYFNVNFVVGKEGHLYLKAKINNKNGLFLFDTGADISLVNEKLLPENYDEERFLTLTDSKGIKQKKRIVKLDSFRLGSIKIKNIKMYPADSSSWTDSKGTFFKNDSVIGVIGNNIIKNYVWDFNMVEKTVTISKSRKYCNNIPDSNAVDLISSDNSWYIPVLINDTQKKLTLDFGCSSPINISDTISLKRKFNIKGMTYKQNSLSAFNHLNPNKKSESDINFVDVSFGTNKFRRIKCFEKTESDLFGIPFIWSFERVVLNFNHDKAYFISRSDSVGKFGVVNISNNFRAFSLAMALNMNEGKAEVTLRNDIKMPIKWITNKNDTLSGEYKMYGNVIFYGSRKNPKVENYSIDSIVSLDSLILPDGINTYGHYTIDCNKKYYYE